MKFIVNISRVLVGLLFIFSGFIKSNDPKGFSYKLVEYFDVFAQDLRADQDTFYATIRVDNAVSAENKELLYHFDTEKQIRVVREKGELVEIPGDSVPLRIVDLNLQNKENELRNVGVALRDSNEVVPVEVSARVGDKIVFTKNFMVDYEDFSDISETIDVRSFIKEDSILVAFFNWLKTKALFLCILICVLEIVLGIAIIIGWKPKLVSWMLLLMIVFFTFLTWYSAWYNKVTDCGCFGDAIKLTPWESFYKDIILLVLILIIWLGRKGINPFFSKGLTVKIVGVFAVLSTTFALYSMTYLPVIDFLPFAEGNDVVKGMSIDESKGERESDLKDIYYLYEINGEQFTVVFNTGTNKFTPSIPEGAKYIAVQKEVIIEPATKPKIHDFENINNAFDGDVTDRMLEEKGYQLWIVCKEIGSENSNAWPKVKELTSPWVKKKLPVYAMTSSPLDVAEALANEEGLPFHFYTADNTLLKTMIRSSPGVILLKGTTIVERWSSRNIPSYDEVIKIME